MEFDSFEQALTICMTAEEGSEEQDAALLYCMNNAPEDLREKLQLHLKRKGETQCGCGCGDK